MATSRGAAAMLLDGLDSIEFGKRADFIMIDLHQPNMQPINNVLKNMVFAGNGRVRKRCLLQSGSKEHFSEHIQAIVACRSVGA